MRRLLLLFLFISTACFAQSTVTLQELGLSFEIPSGWTGGIQGDYYILGHSTIPGVIILSENTSQSSGELKSIAMQGIFEEGVQLSPKGDFKLIGNNKVEGFYEGVFNASRVKCFVIGIINSQGSGLNIMILTTSEAFSDRHISVAKKIASSVEFFAATDTPVTQRWKQELINRQLKYMSSSTSTDYSGGMSGSSDEVVIKLFPNARFYYYSNSNSNFSANSGYGYIDATKSNEGNYRIYSIGVDSYLELKFDDGMIYEYVLTKSKDGETLLNDNRYFVLDINR